MKKFFTFLSAFAMSVLVSLQSSAAIIDIDNTKTGIEAVTFNPNELVVPILIAVGGVIGAVAGYWLINVCVNYLRSKLGKTR